MGAQSSSPPVPLSTTLIGTWELLSRVDRTAAGERRIRASPLAKIRSQSCTTSRSGHFCRAVHEARSHGGASSPAPEPGAPPAGEKGAPNKQPRARRLRRVLRDVYPWTTVEGR